MLHGPLSPGKMCDPYMRHAIPISISTAIGLDQALPIEFAHASSAHAFRDCVKRQRAPRLGQDGTRGAKVKEADASSLDKFFFVFREDDPARRWCENSVLWRATCNPSSVICPCTGSTG
ncbi:hypothetical protein INS49_000678 [Diaporthe citri]|uniref:uncharacterized protein n=1 Tax=Diaporthe citri TaxID=83186 RepID=UPI001C815011|nr:uncharacterized protein INS49_000678 [Diaporthe citri]KAG6366501.1 hypothetical protein INS49_000678 [Diaporthe citri]